MALNKRAIYEVIMNAEASSPEMTKEINRVMTQANHRLDRITGDPSVVSPAVDALGGQRFSLRGKSWSEKQAEYVRALAFLDQDTSTLGGARKFTQQGIEQVFNVNASKLSKGDSQKYAGYIKEIASEYAEDMFHGDLPPDFSWIDSDMVAQYFYEMKLEQTSNDMINKSEDLVKQLNDRMKKNQEEFERELENMLKGSGLKL